MYGTKQWFHRGSGLVMALILASCGGGDPDPALDGWSPDGNAVDISLPDTWEKDPGPDLPVDKGQANDPTPTDHPSAKDMDLPEENPPQECCKTDGDCPPNHYCVGGDLGAGGVCWDELMDDGSCFDDDDCHGTETCKGAQVCSCDMNCPSIPGYCAGPNWPCCFSDDACPANQVCAGDETNWFEGGVCKDIPAEGVCWDDGDCAATETCLGATMCPCGTICGQIEAPGACAPFTGDDCCDTDGDCQDGETCVDLFAEFDLPGACKPVQPPGMCWMHEDCADDEVCVGAIPCPCGWEDGGDGCDIPGACKSKAVTGCCATDGDCPDGTECGPGSTCTPLLQFGQCWTDDDCYATQHCSGVSVCPCGMFCGLGTFPGACEPLPSSCCYSDDDCGDGFVCRAQDPLVDKMPGSCVPHPDGPACPFDAQCCWGDGDCGPDGTCKDAYLCGCVDLCIWCGACAEFQIGWCG